MKISRTWATDGSVHGGTGTVSYCLVQRQFMPVYIEKKVRVWLGITDVYSHPDNKIKGYSVCLKFKVKAESRNMSKYVGKEI